jgi:hypothetical protein
MVLVGYPQAHLLIHILLSRKLEMRYPDLHGRFDITFHFRSVECKEF